MIETSGSTDAQAHRRSRSRLSAAIGSAWTAVMGVLPHVLHHVGPLAGAAIVAGTTGTVVFGLAAFAFTVPLLLRVRKHRGNWRLPAILLTVFVSVWLISTFALGPWIRDQLVDDKPAATQQEPEHEEHHDE